MNRESFHRRLFLPAAAGSSFLAGICSPLLTQDGEKVSETKGQDGKSAGPLEATFERDYDAPTFKPLWKKEQLNRQMLQDFVIFAHSELEMTRKLLDREPGLLNGAVDWGNGDFETALGGASHMGRRDIETLLLEPVLELIFSVRLCSGSWK